MSGKVRRHDTGHRLLQPGDSLALSMLTPVVDILGDSLTPGEYELTVVPERLEPQWFLEVPGGRVLLAP